MRSWWELGESSGYHGPELAVHRIECPFCGEKGNFHSVFHGEKRKANSSKRLNFEVLKCGNCTGFVHVLWSASESGSLHNFEVLPWPTGRLQAPEHWPVEIARFWVQANENVKNENWDAAAVMARSALQAALRERRACGSSLKAEIEDLANKGILPSVMKEWSDELRFLGNESAHPRIGQSGPEPQEVKDAIKFLDFLLVYLYNLPKEISDYRARKNSAPQ
jgi:hypothetical protein